MIRWGHRNSGYPRRYPASHPPSLSLAGFQRYTREVCFPAGPSDPDEGAGSDPSTGSGSGSGEILPRPCAWSTAPILHGISSPQRKPPQAIGKYRLPRYPGFSSSDSTLRDNDIPDYIGFGGASLHSEKNLTSGCIPKI